MQKITIFFLIIELLNCSSLERYSKNRANDLVDIVHVGYEEEVYGFGLLIGYLVIGFKTRNENSKGFGLRFGCR
ncbi:MAG: hypothetical protein SFU98_05020 [Leptospiraceae bacterium]|nr:hypothetical protein [Leptospiraceae bacterium]